MHPGSIIIAEYLAKFTRIERSAIGICTTEADRAKRSKMGLHLDVLESIVAVVFPTLSTAVDATIESERIHREKCKEDTGED